jgi:hypothetical protein
MALASLKTGESCKVIAIERRDPNPGYYLVIKDFKLTPGGGWQIRFETNQVVKYDSDNMMWRWDPLGKRWKSIRPPIEGEEKMTFQYGYGEMEDQWKRFTKPISPADAKKRILDASATALISVSEFDAFVKRAGLKPMDKIHITVAK